MKTPLITSSLAVFPTCSPFEAKIDSESINTLKSVVVSIKVHQTTRAYGDPVTLHGTGFLANKEKGIIITNRHIASIDCPASYEATWENGKTADLNLIWNDPINDFAFLQIDPSQIPADVPQVTFSKTATLGQEVFMIGNNEGISHSMQEGTINDLFKIITTNWQQHVFSISLNSKGGSSGSPVFNDKGQVVGLHCAGSDTSAFSLPIAYVYDALQDILEKKMPARFSTGAIFTTINLDDAQNYYEYNNSHTQAYLDRIHGSRNRLLVVESLLPTLNQPLEVGDLIEKVNGINIGPNQYLIEKTLNETEGKTAKFTVFRKGTFLELDVPLFNLNDTSCSEMLIFGNTVFSTVDPFMSFQTGMPIGSVCIASKSRGSLFDDLPVINNAGNPSPPLVMVKKIHGVPIHTLGDVIKILPMIEKKEKFNYTIKDFSIRYRNDSFHTKQNELSLFAYYTPGQYSQPSLIKFDREKQGWIREMIELL